MRYFLDTEYNGFGGALLSLGLVPEFGSEELYLKVRCPDPPNAWVERNVLPYLDTVPEGHRGEPLDRVEAAVMVAHYLAGDPEPEIVADWPEDIALFSMLLLTGPAMIVDIPPLTFRLLRLPGFSTAVNSAVPHNALHDARSLRDHILGLE